MTCANFEELLILKDLIKFFETKDDLITLSLGSNYDFSFKTKKYVFMR
jgi:hypothetical protein